MMPEPDKGPAVHDQVLVEAQLDGRIVGFRSVVVNVQPRCLWLGLSRADARLERLERNQAVHLTFRRDNAAVVADSAFVAHLGSSKSRLFSVEQPSAIQMVQRRAHLRLDAERAVELRVVNQGDSGGAGRVGRGTTLNISAGGIQFLTGLPLAVGDELEINLELGPNDVVPAEAQVVRVQDRADLDPYDTPLRPLAPAEPAQLAIAVRFLSISEVGEDRIVRHIFSVQRQRRDEARKLAS